MNNPTSRFAKATPQIREREILRVTGTLGGSDRAQAAHEARGQVLRWAQNKAVGRFSQAAWDHQSFEHVSSGRSRVAVRLIEDDADEWAMRVEDPDRTVAGRIWTTEVSVSLSKQESLFTTRLLVGSPETQLDIEPHVPGIVRQIIGSPGLYSGPYKINDKPLLVGSASGATLLAESLIRLERTLPIVVLSVPPDAEDPKRSLVNAKVLAESCAGLAIILTLPADYTWALTQRFGKRLSVYGGAVRVYLPGFTEDANPFGGHELILPEQLSTPERSAAALTRIRWIAANASVRRHLLGRDITPFTTLRLKSLRNKQAKLVASGAPDTKLLDAASERNGSLEAQVEEALRYQSYFSAMHAEAEERSETSETQLRAAGFRIQQLLKQLDQVGATPDTNIALPTTWTDFVDWADQNLAGRVVITPQARKGLSDPEFVDVPLVARCLLWLANDFAASKLNAVDSGSMRDKVIEQGIVNAHCGSDAFEIQWQGNRYLVDWHVKTGGNSRDPSRCLRIYYFWDDTSQQVVIAHMPSHRRSSAS